MRLLSLIILPIALVACAPMTGVDTNNPNARSVNVDDHHISVLDQGNRHYAAWGGADDKDGFVQYRQKRAVELISGCRIDKVTSKKTDDVLQASVKC